MRNCELSTPHLLLSQLNTQKSITMKKLQLLVPALLFMFISTAACSKDDNDSDINPNNNNNGNPNSKITITTTKNGTQVDATTVELIDNTFVPANWAITSAYNSMANLFTLSVAHAAAQPQFNLSLIKQMNAFSVGSFNIKDGQLDNTVYRNVKINPMASYLATNGTFKITKIEPIGSAAGITVNYIDGSFNFDAVNPADSSDVIKVEATFTGVSSPKN